MIAHDLSPDARALVIALGACESTDADPLAENLGWSRRRLLAAMDEVGSLYITDTRRMVFVHCMRLSAPGQLLLADVQATEPVDPQLRLVEV